MHVYTFYGRRQACKVVSVGIMHEYSGKRCMHVILHLIMNLSLSLFQHGHWRYRRMGYRMVLLTVIDDLSYMGSNLSKF